MSNEHLKEHMSKYLSNMTRRRELVRAITCQLSNDGKTYAECVKRRCPYLGTSCRTAIMEDMRAILTPVTPVYEATPVSRAMLCGFCGSYLMDGFKYCCKCGKEVNWFER